MGKAHRLMEEDPRRDDANMWTVVSGLEAIQLPRRQTFLCLQIHQARLECPCYHSLHWGSTERLFWCCITFFSLFRRLGLSQSYTIDTRGFLGCGVGVGNGRLDRYYHAAIIDTPWLAYAVKHQSGTQKREKNARGKKTRLKSKVNGLTCLFSLFLFLSSSSSPFSSASSSSLLPSLCRSPLPRFDLTQTSGRWVSTTACCLRHPPRAAFCPSEVGSQRW